MPKELWTEVRALFRYSDQDHPPKKKKSKKPKWLSEEASQIAEKRREPKGTAEKEICPSECRVPRNSSEG